MGSLWTTVATTMVQRLKRLKDLLGIYLNRQHGLAVLERVQASNLSDADRDLVSRIMRAMLRLPADLGGHKPSAPDAPAPSAHASCRCQRHTT